MLELYVAAKNRLRDYLAGDQRGVTAIEYGLIAGLIAAILVTILQLTGGNLFNIFQKISDAIAQAAQ